MVGELVQVIFKRLTELYDADTARTRFLRVARALTDGQRHECPRQCHEDTRALHRCCCMGVDDPVEMLVITDSSTEIWQPGSNKAFHTPAESQSGWYLGRDHLKLPDWNGKGRVVVAWIAHNEFYSLAKGKKFPHEGNPKARQAFDNRLWQIGWNVTNLVKTSANVIIVMPLGWEEIASTYVDDEGKPYQASNKAIGDVFEDLVERMCKTIREAGAVVCRMKGLFPGDWGSTDRKHYIEGGLFHKSFGADGVKAMSTLLCAYIRGATKDKLAPSEGVVSQKPLVKTPWSDDLQEV